MSARPSDGFMYVAKQPCGCVSALCWDDPAFKADTARFVARCIKRGDAVERVERRHDSGPIAMLCAPHEALRTVRP